MDRQCLVHVDDDEIIIAGLRTGELRGVELGRGSEETLEGIDPCLPFLRGDVTPGREWRFSTRS